MTRFVALLALVIAIISLALNVLLIVKLNQARTGALDVLDHTSRAVDGLGDYSFRHTVRINQTIPIAGELPLNQEFTVPINTTVPVKTTIHTSINTPLGPVDVPAEVDTTIPINLTVPLTISRTIPYSFTVPLDLSVPIEIRLRDMGGDSLNQQIQTEIANLRRSLQ